MIRDDSRDMQRLERFEVDGTVYRVDYDPGLVPGGPQSASRVARLRLAALGALEVDTVIVSASTTYRGVSLGTVQFIIVFENTTPSALRHNH